MRSGAKRVARIKSGSKEMRTVNDSLADRASVKKINGGSFFKAVPPKNGIVGGHTVLYSNTVQYCTVQYYLILYCTVLYCTVLPAIF